MTNVKYLPVSSKSCPRRSILSTVPSFGECNTIVVEPTTHRKHPIFPNKFSRSPRYFEDNTALKNKSLP